MKAKPTMQLVKEGGPLPDKSRKVDFGPIFDLEAAKAIVKRNDFRLITTRCQNHFRLFFRDDRDELIYAFCDLTEGHYYGTEWCHDGGNSNKLCDVHLIDHTFYNYVNDKDETKNLYIKWFFDGKEVCVDFISLHP